MNVMIISLLILVMTISISLIINNHYKRSIEKETRLSSQELCKTIDSIKRKIYIVLAVLIVFPMIITLLSQKLTENGNGIVVLGSFFTICISLYLVNLGTKFFFLKKAFKLKESQKNIVE